MIRRISALLEEWSHYGHSQENTFASVNNSTLPKEIANEVSANSSPSLYLLKKYTEGAFVLLIAELIRMVKGA